MRLHPDLLQPALSEVSLPDDAADAGPYGRETQRKMRRGSERLGPQQKPWTKDSHPGMARVFVPDWSVDRGLLPRKPPGVRR